MSMINDNLTVTGTLQAGTTVLSAGCVNDTIVAQNAGIAAAKLWHRYRKSHGPDAILIPGTNCLHLVQTTNGATLNSVYFGARLIDTNAAHTSNVVLDVRRNGVSVLSSPGPMFFGSAGWSPASWAAGNGDGAAGVYLVGQVVQDNATGGNGYFYVAVVAGGGATAPHLDVWSTGSPTNHWLQVANAGITASAGGGGNRLALCVPTLILSTLSQYDWLDFVIISTYPGAPTIATATISVTGSNATTIKTAATLSAGQTGTMLTGGQAGRYFTVVSGSAPTYTVTSNFANTAGTTALWPAAGDAICLSTISNVGVSTPTLIYTAATLTAGQPYSLSSGAQAGRYFTVVSGPVGGAYVVTSNMTAGPQPGDIIGLGIIPQGLYGCVEVEEAAL